MKTENLNKENFWNNLMEKYPRSVKIFCDWIDEYKKENDWDSLFANGATMPSDDEMMHMVKFHDIPFEMQIGILKKFFYDKFNHVYNEPYYLFISFDLVKLSLENVFKRKEEGEIKHI